MNLLILLIPIWVFIHPLFSAPIYANPDPPLSSISDPVLPTEKQPFSQISSEMEAHSPGNTLIVVVLETNFFFFFFMDLPLNWLNKIEQLMSTQM